MKIRKERFYKIPLCESDCKTWFEDCEDDYTCTDNWTVNMEWKKGEGNRCPRGSSCKTFKQIYRTPKYFCETVWDHSWEVVSDHDHCMRLWFNPSGGNPNDDVARWKAIQIIQDKNRRSVGTSVTPIAFQERAKVAIIIATSVLFTTLGVQNVFLG
jgi:folate receptor